MKKASPAYVPKTPVKAGAPVSGADKGTGIGPLGSGEHPVPELDSSIGERVMHEEEPVPAEAPSLALRIIHEKLQAPVELNKLHLKHKHISLEHFKRRTAALQIPKEIYDLYEQLVKKCSICQKHKKTPSRAKVSGLRSEVFGDLTIADLGELPIPGKKEKLTFLILYDGATNLVTAEVVQDKEKVTTMSLMTEYFAKISNQPKGYLRRRTPLELAFGRRPHDVLAPENAEPNQLTGNPTDQEVTARAVRELANKAYQEARQSDDLRRDLAARLSMSEGPFMLGEKVRCITGL